MSSNRIVSVQTKELFHACEVGDISIVSNLIQHPDVDINYHHQLSYGATPLIIAIANGHVEVVKILLNACADLGETKTPDRNSALHEAGTSGNTVIMEAILSAVMSGEAGAIESRINLQNQFGNTPLHNAAMSGSDECVSYLLKANAKVDICNVNGSIALHHACYSERTNVKIIQLLHEAGSNINLQDLRGYTPLIIATKKNHVEALEYLLHQGADPTICNKRGENAMYFAMLRNHTKIIKILNENNYII